ncbi:TolC family protein [Parvularcula marina]|uniref:TolC family protein n=1 Tax=Parvularcula marina TaxID=2292771 RepID=A0A371RKN9_9PROT|nr:TolC family protein [Parvularcula marina]RFB05946.1 hypothetical protein DX908_12125 [Parvularcula marina]
MRHRYQAGTAILAALTIGSQGIAQEVGGELPPINTRETSEIFTGDGCLTMAAAVEEALNFDPRIDGARARRDAAGADVIATYSRNLPQVSLFGQTGFGDTPPLDRRRDDQIGIELRQELYSFGQRKYAKQASQHSFQAANYGIDEQQNGIAEAVALAYLEYARASSVLELATEQAAAFRQEAESAEKRLERRVITLTDASQLRSRAASTRAQLASAREAEAIARTRLEVLTDTVGLECLDEQSIRGFVAPEAPRILALSPEQAVEEAMSNSPRLRRARSQSAAARARANEASRSNLPTLNLTAFYQHFQEVETDIAGDVISRTEDEDARVGLSLNQELWNGGRTKARKAQAVAQLRSARAEEDLQRLAIDDQIRGAMARASSRKTAGEEFYEARAHARVQFESTQKEYLRGTKTLTDLVLASDEYFTTASQEIDARYGFYSSLIQLYSAMGLLSEDGLR